MRKDERKRTTEEQRRKTGRLKRAGSRSSQQIEKQRLNGRFSLRRTRKGNLPGKQMQLVEWEPCSMWRKPEYLEKTHADTGRTCKLHPGRSQAYSNPRSTNPAPSC